MKQFATNNEEGWQQYDIFVSEDEKSVMEVQVRVLTHLHLRCRFQSALSESYCNDEPSSSSGFAVLLCLQVTDTKEHAAGHQARVQEHLPAIGRLADATGALLFLYRNGTCSDYNQTHTPIYPHICSQVLEKMLNPLHD